MQHVKHTNYKFPQAGSIYPESQRSFIVLGPSGVGKTSAMISLLTGPMKGLHTRIWIVSPSAKKGTDPPFGTAIASGSRSTRTGPTRRRSFTVTTKSS